MMMAAKNNPQQGQALIEFIVFLPLIFALYGMISGFANAINGSINQQKVTRSYYYYRIQNNSMVPYYQKVDNWKVFGMSMIGWARELKSGDEDTPGDPVAPCYKVSIPLAKMDNDNCDDSYSTESTHHIRVGTAYGICGATYVFDQSYSQAVQIPDSLSMDYSTSTKAGGCTIQ